MKMIDRIWYAAEKWRQNEGNHLTGDLLLQTISLWILVPIVGPLTYRLHWLLALLLVVVIGVSPLIFCHARYTSGRRDQLDKKYARMKVPGMMILKVYLAALVISIFEWWLMYLGGFVSLSGGVR